MILFSFIAREGRGSLHRDMTANSYHPASSPPVGISKAYLAERNREREPSREEEKENRRERGREGGGG